MALTSLCQGEQDHINAKKAPAWEQGKTIREAFFPLRVVFCPRYCFLETCVKSRHRCDISRFDVCKVCIFLRASFHCLLLLAEKYALLGHNYPFLLLLESRSSIAFWLGKSHPKGFVEIYVFWGSLYWSIRPSPFPLSNLFFRSSFLRLQGHANWKDKF